MKNKKIIFSIIFFKIILDIIYATYISVNFNYMGFEQSFDIVKYLLSWIFVGASLFPIIKLNKKYKLSNIIILFIVYLSFIPLTTMIAFYPFSYIFILEIVCYWLFIFLFYKIIPTIHLKKIDNIKLVNIIINIGILIISGTILYIWGRYANFRLNINILDVYDSRLQIRESNIPILLNYIYSATKAVNIVLLIYFLGRNEKVYVGLILFLQLISFSINGSKLVFFSTLLVPIIHYLYNNRYLSNIPKYLSYLGILGLVERYLIKTTYIIDIIIRRVFFIPNLLSNYYYDFFSQNSPDFLRQSFLRHFGINSLYDPISNVIGEIYFNRPEMAANNGLFSDAFANYGHLGIIIGPLLVVLVLKFLDACAEGHKTKFYILSAIIISIIFVSSFLFTVLLTHGLIAVGIILYLLPVKERTIYMKKEIPLNKIKLIIWDLDETFWKGTISEEEVTINPKNIELIKKLSSRGIINSICSKNDYDNCFEKLKEIGLDDYFVFNSIDWSSKGQRVKNIIKNMNLRSPNVLFIDDNNLNLKEVEYYNKDIMVSLPNVIEDLIINVENIGKDDMNLSRLKQYKILEKKNKLALDYESNESFLDSSNIKVEIKKDCESNLKRLHELISRTNQLNFTKERIDEKELLEIINDSSYDSGYIEVKDDFGDYGIVGFYSIKNNKLIHFVFSCRTMGMGIEQYVYCELGKPQITIIEPVSGNIDANEPKPFWINNNKEKEESKNLDVNTNNNIFVKGPCDLQVVFSFIKGSESFDTELNYINDNAIQMDHYNHTINIINSMNLTDSQKEHIYNSYSFLPKGSFDTKLFDNKNNVVILSILMDNTLGVYKNKRDGYYIAYGLNEIDITDENNWDKYLNMEVMTARSKFTTKELKKFKNEFKKINYTEKDILNNIIQIREKLDKNTKIILLLGSELEYKDDNNNVNDNKHIFNKKINKAIKKSKELNKIKLIDVNKYILTQSDYFDNINHYSKKVYYKLALDIVNELKEYADLKSENKIIMYYQNIKRNGYKKYLKLKRKFKKIKGG